MTFRAEPYGAFVDDLTTSLTGGITRVRFRNVAEGRPFELDDPDQVVAAMWPARAGTRRAYARALAQRNALLARGSPGREASLDAWDAEPLEELFAVAFLIENLDQTLRHARGGFERIGQALHHRRQFAAARRESVQVHDRNRGA